MQVGEKLRTGARYFHSLWFLRIKTAIGVGTQALAGIEQRLLVIGEHPFIVFARILHGQPHQKAFDMQPIGAARVLPRAKRPIVLTAGRARPQTCRGAAETGTRATGRARLRCALAPHRWRWQA
jgi:hypothetical protein